MIENFIGRSHVLLLHLPIGILLFAIVLEWSKKLKWVQVDHKALSLTYGFGAAAAIVSSISGYILSINNEYPLDLVQNHKWAGIITATLASLIFIIHLFKKINYQHWLALILGGVIAVTGHLGGSITHGEGFLINSADDNKEVTGSKFQVEDVDEALIYKDLVAPILEAKCISCHGQNKVKGKLRMDTPEFLTAGGKSGKSMLGNKNDNSELIRRISLPIGDKKHMPPKKKIQVNEHELEFLKWWIDHGSSLEGRMVDLSGASDVKPLVKTMIAQSHSTISAVSNIPAFTPSEKLNPPDEKILNDLKSYEIVVLPVGINSPYLDINFVNVKKIIPEHLQLLNAIAPHILSLKCSDLNIKDEDLKIIGSMKNLVTLFLNGTEITDSGLEDINNFPHLRNLNLNETQISDSGIKTLVSLPASTIIYAYKTDVTLTSLDNGINIIGGGYDLELLASDTVRIKD